MSFNLNHFINNCKEILPKYFKSLINLNLSKNDINLNKHLILSFLKEYFNHNNNKFNRSQFNVHFFQEFFSELLPNNHPELLKVPNEDLQKILKNFFNYLSLQRVLKKELSQKIALNLNNETDLTKELNIQNFKLVNQDDFEVYSERKLNQILKKSNKWTEEFLNSKYSKDLPIEEKNESGFIIECFFEYLYTYFLKTPKQIDVAYLEEICLYLFPKNVSAEELFFKAMIPILTNFFIFLENKGIIYNANVLCKELGKLRNQIVKAATNPKNWGMAKSLIMRAKKAGVDINNEKELNNYFNFLDLLNLARFNMNNNNFWRTKDVQTLDTQHIIQKLRDFGIPFDKKQFLKDVHRFYSAFDLEREWRANYDITAKGRDEDFIWMAASVLWKRLAPDVINSEQLDDMMQEGYDLITIRKYVEGCALWLKVWEYLKKRFSLEMRSIKEAEQVFSGLQSLYNWCGDLAMELYNAGYEDNTFFEKRIKYCKEFLEFFPQSNDMHVSGMIRDIAESHFALDRVEEGEKVFQELIEKFPENTWGYICWGDKYSNIRKKLYNFDKARLIYNLGLEKCTYDKEILIERIKDLESENEGIKFKKDILSDYGKFLSKKNLSIKGMNKKIEKAEQFMNFLIFFCKIYDFEILDEELNADQILKFLGFWIIQQKFITSKTALIELIRNIKSFIYYLQDYIPFHDTEIKEIKRILNSKEFFIKRLESFQKIKDNVLNSEKELQKLRKWRENYSKWYKWDKSKKQEEEKNSKKVRLSKNKRKLYKDII
jgi:hypothetical protein